MPGLSQPSSDLPDEMQVNARQTFRIPTAPDGSHATTVFQERQEILETIDSAAAHEAPLEPAPRGPGPGNPGSRLQSERLTGMTRLID